MQRIILCLAFLVVLVGCGQSGPLYLPGNPSEIRSTPAQPDATTEQENDGEEPAPKD